jgi:hypothetical protein
LIKCIDIDAEEESNLINNFKLNGYGIVRNYLGEESTSNLLSQINNSYRDINKNGKFAYPDMPDRDSKDKVIYNIFNLDKIFIDFLSTPVIRKISIKILNDEYYRFLPDDLPNYNLLYYNARSSGKALDLHIDSHIPFTGSKTYMMQFLLLLEDSTEENGATIVVPASHQSGSYTDRSTDKSISITGRAGDLIFWDSRLWHGTSDNVTNKSRWALVATMGMWWVKPTIDITGCLKDEIYQKLSDEQKQLLGFCSIPSRNPFERVNCKCGYEYLKKSVKDY